MSRLCCPSFIWKHTNNWFWELCFCASLPQCMNLCNHPLPLLQSCTCSFPFYNLSALQLSKSNVLEHMMDSVTAFDFVHLQVLHCAIKLLVWQRCIPCDYICHALLKQFWLTLNLAKLLCPKFYTVIIFSSDTSQTIITVPSGELPGC